ncbi:hypothetical protein D1115_03675 [Vibrio alfacsensis]|uniref:DKNYY domain-containing protein n=2 Tax=Vibrio alfacsensis TaxID=1074311 RepID=A0ABM6YRR9_9VIBR|nr:hypothetical protein D1115_03675 [Vibrio alfacsensis]
MIYYQSKLAGIIYPRFIHRAFDYKFNMGFTLTDGAYFHNAGTAAIGSHEDVLWVETNRSNIYLVDENLNVIEKTPCFEDCVAVRYDYRLYSDTHDVLHVVVSGGDGKFKYAIYNSRKEHGYKAKGLGYTSKLRDADFFYTAGHSVYNSTPLEVTEPTSLGCSAEFEPCN